MLKDWRKMLNDNYLFYFPYFFFIIVNFLLLTNFYLPNWFAPLSKIPLVLMMGKIVLDLYVPQRTLINKISGLLILLLGVLVALIGKQNFALYYAIILVAGYGINSQLFIRRHLKVMWSLLVFIVVLSLLSVIENEISMREDMRSIRQSFGFGYPTDFASLLSLLFMATIAVKKRGITIIQMLLGLIIAVFLIRFVHARLDTIILIVFIVLAVFISTTVGQELFDKYSKYISYMVFPVCFTVILGLSSIFTPHNALLRSLNRVLADRLALGHKALKNYPITLFGQTIEMNGYGFIDKRRPYFFIDSAYLQLLLLFGVLFTIVVLGIHIKMLRDFHKNKRDNAVIFFWTLAIHGMIAQHIYNPIYSPFWLMAFMTPFKEGEKEAKTILVASQLSNAGGLGTAVNSLILAAEKSTAVKIKSLDITNNKQFFINLAKIFSNKAETLYFTPAGSLFGHLRDLCYLFIAKLSGKKLILHFHNNNFGNVINRSGLLFALNRFLFKYVDRVILLGTNHQKMFAGLGINEDKFEFVNNGVDSSLFITEDEFKQKKGTKIIYFSNMIVEKGYLFVLELGKLLQNSQYEFYFAGKFFDNDAEVTFLNEVEKLPNVQYLSGVYGQDKADLLKMTDIFILPTDYKDETLPIAMLEAMAAANYIVVTDRGVIKEVVNTQTTTIIDELSATHLAKIIEAIPTNLEYDNYQIDALYQQYEATQVNERILEILDA